MALKLLPPEHSIDAERVWISPEDDAFDVDLINAHHELAVAAGEKAPLEVYFSGETRFNLDAPLRAPAGLGLDKPSVTVHDYLREDVRPVEFVLRRLTARERARVYARLIKDDQEAYIDAAKFGCTDIRGGEADGLVWRSGEGGLADKVLDQLDQKPLLLMQLGAAVLRLTQLTPTEGKR